MIKSAAENYINGLQFNIKNQSGAFDNHTTSPKTYWGRFIKYRDVPQASRASN